MPGRAVLGRATAPAGSPGHQALASSCVRYKRRRLRPGPLRHRLRPAPFDRPGCLANAHRSVFSASCRALFLAEQNCPASSAHLASWCGSSAPPSMRPARPCAYPV
jgi:hypothetical protein